jgi:hypothetical protein
MEVSSRRGDAEAAAAAADAQNRLGLIRAFAT